jgi:hypothetical protein
VGRGSPRGFAYGTEGSGAPGTLGYDPACDPRRNAQLSTRGDTRHSPRFYQYLLVGVSLTGFQGYNIAGARNVSTKHC